MLLVWASDRIARSVRHFLEVLDELNHLNIEFVSFRENLDTGGPLGRAVVIIIGALIVYLASEWMRELGNVQMIVFSAVVIVFARFFRTGLWGLATRK